MKISDGWFNNSPGSNTSRTNRAPYSAATGGKHMNFFQVWQPTPTSLIIGMGDIIPGNRPFSTDFTYFRHRSLLPLLLSPLLLYQQAIPIRHIKLFECVQNFDN